MNQDKRDEWARVLASRDFQQIRAFNDSHCVLGAVMQMYDAKQVTPGLLPKVKRTVAEVKFRIREAARILRTGEVEW